MMTAMGAAMVIRAPASICSIKLPKIASLFAFPSASAFSVSLVKVIPGELAGL